MIVRVCRRRERPYVVLETATLRLKKISFKARGLWAMCMTYPDDWEFRMDHLASMSEHDGKGAVRSALKELEAKGLAALEEVRGDGGQMAGKRWVIYESPDLNPSCQRQGGLFDVDAVVCDGGGDVDNFGGAVEESGQKMSQNDRRAGFPNVGFPERRFSRTSGNRTLRINDKARSNEYSRSNDFHEKEQQQQKTSTLDLGGDGVAAVDGCGYGAVALSSGVPSLAGVLPAAASFEDRSGLLEALVAQGVDEPVAGSLVDEFPAEHVRAMLERGDREAKTPGWYVKAIREGYHSARTLAVSMLETYDEALARYQQLTGGGSAERPFTDFYAVEHQEDGSTMFRRWEEGI
ncbi:MAG: hypothetical protein O7F16_09945 [Acidobacteria bacterium]|nr:hypothetical protein [Acidobacteriota bacterium]